MPYRIRPGKAFTGEVRAVAEEQLRAAISAFEDQPRGIHEAIHDARKKFKRIRSLYRLVAFRDKPFRQAENARLRDTAAGLALVRDATALIETLAYLEGNAATPEEEQAIAHARAALTERRDVIAAAETDLDEKVGKAIGNCHDAIAALDGLRFDDHPRKTARLLAKGWKRSLDRARQALDACHETAHTEVFHELRKSAQAYWMNLSLLRDIWPTAMRSKRTEAKTLVDTLGHEHDIALLVELLDREPDILGGGEELSHLLGAIIRQQQQIRTEALALAERLFSDPPAREARIIELLWLEAATN